MSKWTVLPAAAALLALGALPATAAPAVMAAAPSISQAADDGVTDTRYRGRHYHRHGGWGRGVGIGLGIGVLGAIIANEAYRPRAGYYYDDYSYDGPYYEPSGYAGDPRRLCAQNFRSFEWSTGLYTTYSGDKRVCPYLR